MEQPSLIKVTHDDLVMRAEKWLKSQNCKVVIRDPFRTMNQEQPDTIGWRDGVSILIEAKASRADFLADKKKWFRKYPEKGMGDWRFYICEPDVIRIEDLPEGWGLLYVTPKTIKKVHGIPTNCNWHNCPHTPNKRAETVMLVSALRRLQIRGYLPEIYEGMI